jgi:hypothetical protein
MVGGGVSGERALMDIEQVHQREVDFVPVILQTGALDTQAQVHHRLRLELPELGEFRVDQALVEDERVFVLLDINDLAENSFAMQTGYCLARSSVPHVNWATLMVTWWPLGGMYNRYWIDSMLYLLGPMSR